MREQKNQIQRPRVPELELGHQTNWCRRPAPVPELSRRDHLQLPVPEPARRIQTHRPPEQERERQIRTHPRQEPEPDSWPVPPELLLRGLGSRRRILRLPGPVLLPHRRLGRELARQRRIHRRLARGQQVPRRPRERELRS